MYANVRIKNEINNRKIKKVKKKFEIFGYVKNNVILTPIKLGLIKQKMRAYITDPHSQ